MIEAAAFWALYYSSDLSRLLRHFGRDPMYSGLFDDYSRGEFLPTDTPFEVGSGSLREYDYGSDPRFYFRVYDRFESCLAAVLGSPLMEQETVPHWREMHVLTQLLDGESLRGCYAEVRTELLRQLSARPASPIRALEILIALGPTQSSYGDYQRTGDTIYLGAQRDILIKAIALYRTNPLFTQALVDVVQNRFSDIDSVRKAIWALGRQNDKAALPLMTDWLSRSWLNRFSVDVERAIQFQLSGSDLIPLSYDQEHDYWKRHLEERIHLSGEEWTALDTESALWEKRMRIASSADSLNPQRRAMLAVDEISLIRQAIGREPTAR